VKDELEILIKKGLRQVIIFGVVVKGKKGEGELAYSDEGPT
jgi:delta-aminolevulinic acid dehydratase/porphobilinogen synthase